MDSEISARYYSVHRTTRLESILLDTISRQHGIGSIKVDSRRVDNTHGCRHAQPIVDRVAHHLEDCVSILFSQHQAYLNSRGIYDWYYCESFVDRYSS